MGKKIPDFVHLHNHTHYSLLDGLAKPKEYAEQAKSLGCPAVAITDHGSMYGIIDFYKTAKGSDIKPVLGCEAYIARNGREMKRPGLDIRPFHLVLLAKNQEGYKNLLKLITKANLEGFYYKPRIDHELLEKYGKNLIALSACLQGEIPNLLRSDDSEGAERIIKKHQKYFGKENYYLEIQSHPNIPEQISLNKKIIKIAKNLNISVVVTNDCHYAKKTDAQAQDALLCVQTGKTLNEEQRMKMEGDFSMKPPKQIFDELSEYLEKEEIEKAFENTVEVSEKCNLDFNFGTNLIPAFPLPKGKTSKEYLEEKCIEGLEKKYSHENEDYREKAKRRLTYELDLIHRMGFDEYFLIVWDFVKFAKDSGIMVGPGRGSAAGSIVAYALDITGLDPLKYNLLFERFLNPERVSMPDIDIDFADNRRDEVLDYVTQKYGKMNVAQISTFGTFAARASVKDVGRVMSVPYSEMDMISKMIPGRPGTMLEDALKTEKDLKKTVDSNPKMKKVFELARKIEGGIRHVSVHACAVVISEKPLTEYTPLQYTPGEENQIMAQYSMKPLESLGLLKMDFLGLKNLTILQKTLNIIRRTKSKNINIQNIPLDDKKTFKALSEGDTTGVFQLESSGMRRYLKELKPTQFEDIIAMVSLYRPGPMDWIPSYIQGKHNPRKVKYIHKSLEAILRETYGIAVYQEQILQIAQEFAGYSLGEADILRRAIGKKIPEELEAQRGNFIEGAKSKGYSEKIAVTIFEKVIEPFAGYGFNKSHAAGYALIAYQTAYLKTHYPTEFMAALMSTDRDNTDKLIHEIAESEKIGIKVLPPDINESLTNFTVIAENKIRFGLAAVKGIGAESVKGIIKIREEGGEFKSLENFIKRVNPKILNKKFVEALAFSGALDDFGERKQIAQNQSKISEHAKRINSRKNSNQLDIFGGLNSEDKEDMEKLRLEEVEPLSQIKKLQLERDYLGVYISSHPLEGLSKFLESLKVKKIKTLRSSKKNVLIAGIVSNIREITTKSFQKMAYINIEDLNGKIEVVLFPKILKELSAPKVGDFIFTTGRQELRNGEKQFIADDFKISELDKIRKRAKDEDLFDEEEKATKFTKDISEEEIREIKIESSLIKKSFLVFIPEKASKENLSSVKNILENHKGVLPVDIIFKNGKDFFKKNTEIYVDGSVKLKEELKKTIGYNAVV